MLVYCTGIEPAAEGNDFRPQPQMFVVRGRPFSAASLTDASLDVAIRCQFAAKLIFLDSDQWP